MNIAAAVRADMMRRLRDYFAGKALSRGEKISRLQRQICALESQGKYCPPEIFANLRRELKSLK